MSYEAQRLINISLGKIASSRIQRGGLRLHKSLMVANVIVNARTYALTDATNFNPSNRPSTPIPHDHEQFEDEQYHNSNDEIPDNDFTELSNLIPDILESVSECENKEIIENDRLENQVPDVESKFAHQEFGNYRAKRKREISEDCDSIILNCDKRLRLEQDQNTSPQDEPFSNYDVLISSENQDDCLNDLAENFHMSFQGLLHHSHSENCLTFTAEDYNQNYESFKLNFNKLPPKTDSIILCSLQIREALDMLSRPAITMNV